MIGDLYTEEEFREIVALDVRGVADPVDSRMLRVASLVRYWLDYLKDLKRDIELQRTRKAANLSRAKVQLHKGWMDDQEYRELNAQYHEWLASSGNLLKGVESRIAEAKRLKEKYEKEAA